MWRILYKSRPIVGENNCDTCIVKWNTPSFQWETWHKNIRSAMIAITKYENAQRENQNG